MYWSCKIIYTNVYIKWNSNFLKILYCTRKPKLVVCDGVYDCRVGHQNVNVLYVVWIKCNCAWFELNELYRGFSNRSGVAIATVATAALPSVINFQKNVLDKITFAREKTKRFVKKWTKQRLKQTSLHVSESGSYAGGGCSSSSSSSLSTSSCSVSVSNSDLIEHEYMIWNLRLKLLLFVMESIWIVFEISKT